MVFAGCGGEEFAGVHSFDGIEIVEGEEGVGVCWVAFGGFDAEAGEADGFVLDGILDFLASRGIGLIGEHADFEEGVGLWWGVVCGGELMEGGEDLFEGGGFLGDAEEVHGARDEVFGEGRGLVEGQVDLADAVVVGGFREGEGDGASGVDGAVGGTGLWAVEVTEGDVFEFGREGGRGEFFAVADDDGALGIGASEAGLDGAVSHGDEGGLGIFGGFEGEGELGGLLVEGGDAFEVGVIGGGQEGEVWEAEEGDGDDECAYGSGGVAEGDDEFLESDVLFGVAFDGADGAGVCHAEEFGGRFEASGCVVISCGEDDLEGGEGVVGGADEVEQAALGGGAGVDGVEHVTGDEQGVGTMLVEEVEEVLEECVVFGFSIEAVEGLTEVPVCGVEEAHGRGEVAAGYGKREGVGVKS